MREILFSKQADKFLEKLNKSDKNLARQFAEEISFLQKNPLHNSTKKLVRSNNLYRVRVAKYRMIYRFDEEKIYLLVIAKREDVYDFLKN